MHCLILDDNPVDIERLKDVLPENFATRVDEANTVDKAMELVHGYIEQDDQPDIAFVDLRLEQESGLTFISTLQQMRSPISVIVLTGIEDGVEYDRAQEMDLAIIPKSKIESNELVQSVCLKAISRWNQSRREQARAVVEHRERLLLVAAGIAHEMTGAVNMVNAAFKMLAKKASVSVIPQHYIDERFEQLRSALAHSEYLADLLCSFGEMATWKANLVEQSVEPLLLNVIKNDLPGELSKNIFMTVDCDRPFLLDERIVRHLFRILGDNAKKYCQRDGKILVRATETMRDTRRFLVVEFEDDGPGVPIRYRESIFTPADRGPFRTEKLGSAKGYGLGLAAASKAIGQHTIESKKGRITCVEPIELNGACFRMTFPGGAV